MPPELGPICTKGGSYRARAEARQRAYRTEYLHVGHGRYGHLLTPDAADHGSNFVSAEAFEAAKSRMLAGKGVTRRTFDNMLASQAMCFNIFAPLASRPDLATRVLRRFIPALEVITDITIEHTPAGDVFGDQSGLAGVDCDVLIEGRTATGSLVQVVETKFVEREFSTCGFRKPGRAEKQKPVCPQDVGVRHDRSACLYVSAKGYRYWQRSDEHDLLAVDAVQDRGCPFGGCYWQPWLNLALAHEEATRRGAIDVRYAVCASSSNTALLGNGEVIEGFKALLSEPQSVSLIDIEALVPHIRDCAPPDLADWAARLAARYAGI